MFTKIRKFISTDIALLTFKTFILHRLEYRDIFLIVRAKKDLSKLQKYVNLCLRVCFPSNSPTSNVELRTKAKLLPLYLRRQTQ